MDRRPHSLSCASPPTSPQRDPGTVEAVVVAGRRETPYRRAGAGSPVLLLSPGSGRTLFDDLASCFRVIAPRCGPRATAVPPLACEGGDDLAGDRLADLLDGLGLERPGIVAVGATALGALSFTLRHPRRVARLALLAPHLPGSWTHLAHLSTSDRAVRLPDARAEVRIPLLVLGLGRAPEVGDDASDAAALVSFLRGDRDP